MRSRREHSTDPLMPTRSNPPVPMAWGAIYNMSETAAMPPCTHAAQGQRHHKVLRTSSPLCFQSKGPNATRGKPLLHSNRCGYGCGWQNPFPVKFVFSRKELNSLVQDKVPTPWGQGDL